MPLPPSPVPPEAVHEIGNQLQALVLAQRDAASATLAAAIVSAMGRPVTLAEVVEIQRDVSFSLYPQRNYSSYSTWQATRAKQLTEPYK